MYHKSQLNVGSERDRHCLYQVLLLLGRKYSCGCFLFSAAVGCEQRSHSLVWPTLITSLTAGLVIANVTQVPLSERGTLLVLGASARKHNFASFPTSDKGANSIGFSFVK